MWLFNVSVVRHQSASPQKHKKKGKKRTLEDILIECEIRRAKSENEKLRLEIDLIKEKRSEEKEIAKLKLEILNLKKQCLLKEIK